jgi:DHA2 family multidrug resistance protein
LLGTQLSPDWSLVDFIPMVLLQSVGQCFTIFPIIIILLSNSDPNHATAFSAYVQVIRLASAEISVSLMTTWLRVREQIHSNYLGLHVTTGDPSVTNLLGKLTTYFSVKGEGVDHQRAVAVLAQTVQDQANTLSYIDGFWLTVWFSVIAFFCIAGISAAPPGRFTPRRAGT